MKKTYLEISRRIGTLDFGRLYPGFHPFRFALYNDKKVCFGETEIPWDSRFVANTAIDYNNEIIAIWDMKCACTDLDYFASLLVHEMLHAYQHESGIVFPDDLVGIFYPRNLDNFTLRFRENQLLAGLAEKFDATAWKDFKAIRAYRRQKYQEAVDYEIKTESIEGSAQFVELSALKQLSPELYRKRLDRILLGLRSPKNIFDARLLSYDTGSLIRMVMADNSLDQPDWAQEKPCTGIPSQEASDIREEFDKYFSAIDKEVQELLSGAEKLDISGRTLTGFDPYNVRSSGNYLYHPNFIGVTNHGEKPEFFTGTFITKMVSRTKTIEEAWRAVPTKQRE